MEEKIDSPSLTEKHNAMISYCFLAVFMLLSPREEFRSNFVRSHARYAGIIHLGFLLLIIFLVRSRNFSSIILYDFTWIHALLSLLFCGLLILLGNGLYSALRGKKPRIDIHTFSLKGLEEDLGSKVAVSEQEKTLIILSHIPFFGIYLSAKYGGKTQEGEKFGNWLIICLLIAINIDPSLTLFVVLIIGAIFWLVHQCIGNENTSIHLLGTKLWDGNTIHRSIKNTLHYLKETFQHGKKIPSFNIEQKEPYTDSKNQFEKSLPILYVPIINIVKIIQIRNEQGVRVSLFQGIIITLGTVYSILSGDVTIGTLSVLAGFWGYIQSAFDKNSYIPIVGECAEALDKALQWKKNKSIPQEIHLQTHQ